MLEKTRARQRVALRAMYERWRMSHDFVSFKATNSGSQQPTQSKSAAQHDPGVVTGNRVALDGRDVGLIHAEPKLLPSEQRLVLTQLLVEQRRTTLLLVRGHAVSSRQSVEWNGRRWAAASGGGPGTQLRTHLRRLECAGG